jgi:hypothetical protein
MLALLAVLASGLSACTPTPEPTPTPTAAFASEEEAFAAAEEVYREYNDAVNAQREDVNAGEPQEYLTALALQSDIDATRIFESNGVHIEGPGKVTSFEGSSSKLNTTPATVSAHLCLDVSATRVVDDQGNDRTPEDRAGIVALDVEFVVAEQSLLISSSSESQTNTC